MPDVDRGGDGVSDEEEVSTTEEEQEIVVVDELPKAEESKKAEPVEDPELERLRAENEALRKVDGTGSAIKDGFAFLQERLSQNGVPAQPPAPPEDEEKFWEGVEQGLFDKQPRKALQQAIDKQARKLVRDELGPYLVAQMEAAFENAEWRLRNDAKEGEIFSTYEKEVYAELKKLPPLSQKDPRALREVYARVKGNHIDDIIEARVKKTAEAAPPAEQPKAANARRVTMEGHNTVVTAPVKKQVYITKSEKAKADRIGMKVEDYMALKERRGKEK
jgi:hypothetical protein